MESRAFSWHFDQWIQLWLLYSTFAYPHMHGSRYRLTTQWNFVEKHHILKKIFPKSYITSKWVGGIYDVFSLNKPGRRHYLPYTFVWARCVPGHVLCYFHLRLCKRNCSLIIVTVIMLAHLPVVDKSNGHPSSTATGHSRGCH